MTSQLLTGVWTYRSFVNAPDPVDDFNALRIGQGELVFEVVSASGLIRGQLAFRGTPPAPAGERIALTGSVGDGGAFSFRLRGTAVAGSVYEYVGQYGPGGPGWAAPRPTLVGTFTRLGPGGGPVEAAGSFIAVQRDFPEPRTVIAIRLPDAVRAVLAAKPYRLHHMVWHAVRLVWRTTIGRYQLDNTKRQAIRDLGWQPGGEDERPAMAGPRPFVTNGSGEDFLFMHRGMVQDVNRRIEDASGARIDGWRITPAPAAVGGGPSPDAPAGNPTGFSVPPPWVHPTDEMQNRRYARVKSDEYYWARMFLWDQEFKNPQYLATLTLGEMGTLIEFGIHADMHRRWASVPRLPSGEPKPDGRDDEDIRNLWDHPDYDHLDDFYASHVNPVFWRLHGWVDDRINDWYEAHQAIRPGEVVKRTAHSMGRDIEWFEAGRWVQVASPWTGPEHGHGGHDHDGHGHHGGRDHDVEVMKQVMAIIFGPSPPEADRRSLAAGTSEGTTGISRVGRLSYPYPEE